MNRLLAQINIGELKAPLDHPSIADFVNNLDKINELAENSPGFVWRLKDDQNNATSFNPYGNDKFIVNISVWENLDMLRAFVYKTEHMEFLKRRTEWFLPMNQPHMALWWTDKDNFPNEFDGKERLDHLWKHGPTKYAFDYRSFDEFR